MKAHFKIETASLVKALAFCRRITEKATTLPILEMVKIEAHAGGVSITATDLDTELVLKVAGEGSGALLIPTHALSSRLVGMGVGVTELATASESMVVGTINNRLKVTLPTLPVADYPALDLSKKPVGATVLNSDVFGWAIEACAPAISTEETRYYLNGIHLASDKFEKHKGLRAVATNGHMLIRANLPEAQGLDKLTPEGINVILGRKPCLVLEALLRETEIEADIEIRQHAGKKLTLQAGEWVMRTKTIDGEFPDAQRVMPPLDPKFVTIRAEAPLLEASVRALARTATTLRFEAGESNANLSTGKGDDGTFETIACQASRKLTFSVNSRYLADVLANCDEDAIIVIQDASSPMRIINTAERDLIQVLMPMRTSGAEPHAEPEVKALPAPTPAKPEPQAAKPAPKAATKKAAPKRKATPTQAAA